MQPFRVYVGSTCVWTDKGWDCEAHDDVIWIDVGGDVSGQITPRGPIEIGAGGGGGDNGSSGPKKAVFNRARFDVCLMKYTGAVLLGAGEQDNGPGRQDDVLTTRLTVDGKPATVQTTFNVSSVGLGHELFAKGIGDDKPNSGATFGDSPFHNYIATEVYVNIPIVYGETALYTDIGFLGLRIHETANAAAGIRYLRGDSTKRIGDFGAETRGLKDHDAGAAVEKCTFGGIVNLRTGTVGNSRGL